MATFFVPVERKTLPATNPNRWFILELDTPDPVSAIAEASRQVREDMRLKGVVIWAAVRDIPPFEHLQELRESMDACRHARGGRKLGPIGSSIPGYC